MIKIIKQDQKLVRSLIILHLATYPLRFKQNNLKFESIKKRSLSFKNKSCNLFDTYKENQSSKFDSSASRNILKASDGIFIINICSKLQRFMKSNNNFI